ncbi:hypothetical protein H6P81_020321 [Aristolochia fimbriata]|uniref:DUF7903 domain-containing protein n=1 Tax=Aristolochia fimbriata TaxID=158543 RepID=A0AAV7DXC9_ARIFI|nr:hypothetical protein H6P81_020321 [Aristolochia fimbriata]
MAYIPPHKRHSSSKPSPTPEKFVQEFDKKLNLGSRPGLLENRNQQFSQSGKIVYAPSSISRWWPIGLMDGLCPSSVKLQPVPCELIERKGGEKPLAFVHDCLSKEENEMEQDLIKSPWSSITEEFLLDLQVAAQNVRKQMEMEGSFLVKPSLVARFGKVLFHGGPSMTPNVILKSVAAESSSRNKVNKIFYTNVEDRLRPKSTITCKCTVKKDGSELVIEKLNQVRHLVIDISCLNKSLDVRLMLCRKFLMTSLADEEQGIVELVNSAIIDPSVKGGLRWPYGKQSLQDRFSVVGIWHTKHTIFKNQKMQLKLRSADRFDFQTSMGETAEEVTLKMSALAKQLVELEAEEGVIAEMVQETLKLIWENFLSCDCSFPWIPKT